MDTFLESAWSEDDYHAAELAGDITPAMGAPFGTATLVPADASKIFSSIAMRLLPA
jgi:hypothetical protein